MSDFASDIGIPGGLLHDMPGDVIREYGLDSLLNECAKPSTIDGRMRTKDKLLSTLKDVSKRYF